MDAEENTGGSVTSLSKTSKGKKKKSAVAKLAEKRRLSRTADGGSEYGSAASLRSLGEKEKSPEKSGENSPDKKQQETSVKSHSEGQRKSDNHVVVGDDPEKQKPPKAPPRKLNVYKSPETDTFPEGLKDPDLIEGRMVSIYDKVEPTPVAKKRTPSPASRHFTSKLERDDWKKELFPKTSTPITATDKAVFSGKRAEIVELSPPEPMDVEYESDKEKDAKDDTHINNNNTPSDATVHRFRALKMAPDRSRSEESLKNCQFVPKPPTTPRSGRSASKKGEKRNRENNSSGEEADLEAKKQHSIITDGDQSKANGDSVINKVEPEMKVKEEAATPFNTESSSQPVIPQVKPRGLMLHPDALANSGVEVNRLDNVADSKKTTSSGGTSGKSSGKQTSSGKKKSSKVKVKKAQVAPMSLDGGEIEGNDSGRLSPTATIDTIGSASDLRSINEGYKAVLRNAAKDPLLDISEIPSVLPSPKAGAGRLAPLSNKSLPPPLPHDVKSSTLRTSYKTDPSYTMAKYFGSPRIGADNISQNSLPNYTNLLTLSTKEVRQSRIKQGSLAATLLSSTELDRYFPERRVGIWAGCWNMAEIKDVTDSLDDFLLPEISEYVQDIYAIGTQENSMNKKEWEILLQETLGPSHVLFHSATHGALHIAIFVKRDLIWFCTVPEDDIVQTRAVTMVKTKGAVAICFSFFGTSFLFINSHLAPGDERKKDRLDDYDKIIKHLHLPKSGNSSSPGSSSSKDVTARFDGVFWMGDLNFRIEVYQGKEAVEELVHTIVDQEHPNFEDLVARDQLTKYIVEGNIFDGFQEGRINFKPTYKFDIGKDTYDTSTKNRIPSYTDRVLFRARKKNSITCTHYNTPTSVKCSDHRPVFALFEAAIKPARDMNLTLAAGQFDRAVYAEATKRLSKKVDVVQAMTREKSSKVCVLQ